jgi:hypothetical protein
LCHGSDVRGTQSEGVSMGTSVAAEARRPAYLMHCPSCRAENGVTASSCWNCEKQLVPRRTVSVTAPAGQATAVKRTRAEGEPSFFPVLREEIPGSESAANDGDPVIGPPTDAASIDDELPSPVPPRSRTVTQKILIGLGGVAAAALLLLGPSLFVSFTMSPAWEADVPPPAPVARLPRVPAALPVMAPAPGPVAVSPPVQQPVVAVVTPDPAPAAEVAPPVAARQVAVAVTPVSPPKARHVVTPKPIAPVAPPPPPPVQARCTAEVVALGLCSTVSR